MLARPPVRRPPRRQDGDGDNEEQDAFASGSEASSASSDGGYGGKGRVRSSQRRDDDRGPRGEKGRTRGEGEDGEEQTKAGEVAKKEEKEDDEEVKVPRDTRYFLHDNRGAQEDDKEGTSDDENGKGAGKGRKHASESDGPWVHDKFFELEEERAVPRVSLDEWRQSTRGTKQVWNEDSSWSQPKEWVADEWSEVSRGWSEPREVPPTKLSGSRWDGTSWWDSNAGEDSWNEWSSGDSWEAGSSWGRSWDSQWHSQGGPKGNPKGGQKGINNWDGLDTVSEDDAGTQPSEARPVKRYTQMTF